MYICLVQKWQKEKAARHVILNMMVIFTDFVSVRVMTKLQDRLLGKHKTRQDVNK